MKFKNIILSVIVLSMISSCDFVDVVPDNVSTIDNAFTMRSEAEKYLFTVYSYIPPHADPEANPGLLSGDETWLIPGINPSAWRIAKGEQNVVNPFNNYWDGGNRLFLGIRDANIFLENIGSVKDLDPFERDRWIAEVKFLKAFYNFWLLRMYGPIPIIEKNLPISSGVDEVKVARRPVDEVIDYIVELIDEAAPDLPEVIQNEVTEQGRITKSIALAIKAKVLTMAASPLFNGNGDYPGFTTEDGTPLINPEFDPQKWERAAEAARQAIDTCLAAGMQLHTYQPQVGAPDISDSTQVKMDLRTAVTEEWNAEIIWANTNSMVGTVIQGMATPRIAPDTNPLFQTRGLYAPTLRIAELFYTEHGVPINEDNTWDYAGRYNLRTATEDDRYYLIDGYETAALHFDREPRFYAGIGFDGSIWYGNSRWDDNDTWGVKAKLGQLGGRASLSRYSATGYFNKKLVNARNAFSGSSYQVEFYPFPVMRLSDLYLLYAEALNEAEGPTPEVYEYINKVRTRAGIPNVQDAWSTYSTQPEKYQTKGGLREIIHQERLIELAFEGQRIWDLKRWKKARDVLNSPIRGWTIDQETPSAYYRVRTIFDLSFSQRDYFWPISERELLRNPKLVQNPGW